MRASPRLDQFTGCLLGLAVGDALGAPFEGLTDGLIDGLIQAGVSIDDPGESTIHYTDDTQMMIGVAEVLADLGRIDEEILLARFASNFDSDRGYGPGMRLLLGAIREGEADRDLALNLFPGGSLGNGAAMRVAPIGLLHADDLDRVAEEAERSARPTHLHPIGIDGARILAMAIALATREGPFRRKPFFADLAARATTEEFRWQLEAAAGLRRSDSLGAFGNSLEAHRSVTTAIAIFAASPDDYCQVVRRAICQGNDTDTLAAMSGALAGARLGVAAIPTGLLDKLEDSHQGRSHIERLATRLHERSQNPGDR